MSQDPRPDELQGTEQPFVAHLVELRDRLIRALMGVGLCFIALALYRAHPACTTCWPRR